MPYFLSDEEDGKAYFAINSIDEKIVAKYCNLSIVDVMDLDCFDYWGYLRDAIIYNLSQTEKGREKLEMAWILTQTKPDRAKLRETFGKR